MAQAATAMSAAHHLQPVLTALVVSSGIAYVLDYFQAHAKVLGGTKKEDMPTWDGKWKEAERERFMGNMVRLVATRSSCAGGSAWQGHRLPASEGEGVGPCSPCTATTS